MFLFCKILQSQTKIHIEIVEKHVQRIGAGQRCRSRATPRRVGLRRGKLSRSRIGGIFPLAEKVDPKLRQLRPVNFNDLHLQLHLAFMHLANDHRIHYVLGIKAGQFNRRPRRSITKHRARQRNPVLLPFHVNIVIRERLVNLLLQMPTFTSEETQ